MKNGEGGGGGAGKVMHPFMGRYIETFLFFGILGIETVFRAFKSEISNGVH